MTSACTTEDRHYLDQILHENSSILGRGGGEERERANEASEE
jgi:hypothetical protein